MSSPPTAVHAVPVQRDALYRLPLALEDIGTPSRCRAGEIIYYQDDPADYWYKVLSGAARKTALMLDGRRHIVMFLLAGDLFGFGGKQKSHHFSAEAITDGTTIIKYPRRRIEALAESDPAVGRTVREAAFITISGLQTRMVLLGRNSALERVSAFLLETAERLANSDGAILLPMSRYDIADYLAISVETVSRAMTVLRGRGVIALNGSRQIEMLDRSALTRGLYSCGSSMAGAVDRHQGRQSHASVCVQSRDA